MRFARHLPSLLALPSLVSASFNCEAVQDGVIFDFRALKGSHSVTLPPVVDPVVTVNRTWVINPCGPIMKEKDTPAEEQCPAGTQVCGIERVSLHHATPSVDVIPVAGDIDGRHADPAVKRLKASDPGREGLRVTLNGGLYDKTNQQAVIEFICDPDRTGLEGDEETRQKREDEKGEKDKSLKFVSYDTNNTELHVLKLEWKTKYACEGTRGEDPAPTPDPDPAPGSSWGFFTWFIIILFLGVAAYFIFSAWLAYNQYGARGRFTTNVDIGSWDLLPHRDTIRDIPYLLKDWARRVIGTLQGGGGGGGGYSAV